MNFVGLAGLVASFFSIIYAYSRQVFALSRAGYLPSALSLTNKNHAPTWAIVIPGIIGFILSLTGEGDLLILMAVFGATISYVLMMLSHIAHGFARAGFPSFVYLLINILYALDQSLIFTRAATSACK